MAKRLTISILALTISSAIFLSSCEGESQKLSGSESSGEISDVAESSESISDSEDISTEAPETTSESISEDISTDRPIDISESISEAISEDVSIDFSDALAIPDGFKGHRMGEVLALVDFERGFGFELSAEDELFGNLHFKLYAKGDSLYADVNMVALKAVLVGTGDEIYILDHKTKKYQKSNGTAEDMRHIFQLEDYVDENLVYVSTIEKDIDGVTYVVEQYKEADKSDVFLECYFKDGKLEMCEADGRLAKINITDKIPEDIFEIPDGYKELMPEDIIAVSEEYKDTSIGKALSKYNGKDGFILSATEEDIDSEGNILGTAKKTISIKGDKVRVDSDYISKLCNLTHTKLYLDGHIYNVNHEEKSYVTETGNFISLGGGVFDRLVYHKTEMETIDGVSYTVDVFYVTLNGTVIKEDDYEKRFYTLDGEWKYTSSGGELVKISIDTLGDADEIFRIPDGYTLECK